MAADKDSILQATIAGLETGLRVRHITTYALDTCQPDDDIGIILTDQKLTNFDCIPVRDGGVIVGYVQREQNLSGSVRSQMKSIEESVLVSADLPLPQYISRIHERPFRMVLDGATIQGIVTWSDLQKLPVRLFVFSLVTHLEMVMARSIRRHFPRDEEWLQKISQGRRQNIEEKRQYLARRNLEPPLIELTDFCDKRDILAKSLRVDKRFIPDLKAIEELRNTTAHAGTYAESRDAVLDFVKCLQCAEHWIDYLTDIN